MHYRLINLMTNSLKSYTEMIKLDGYDERLEYLRLRDNPHMSPRNISLDFYKHRKWLATRDAIIKRDLSFELGVFGMYIHGPIYVHHINPVDESHIERWDDLLFDPNNLICCSHDTHMAIHYGVKKDPYVERKPGDTKLW